VHEEYIFNSGEKKIICTHGDKFDDFITSYPILTRIADYAYHLLQKIDSAWKEHLQQINTLRETIGWRGYGQKDPLIEYKNEAYNLFLAMTNNIRHSVVYLIFRSQPILKI
jgi:preprotein translocase subunit SecA